MVEVPDTENPPLTATWFAAARNASEVLPEIVSPDTAGALLKRRGRPKAVATKAQVTLRLDRDVIAGFRQGGAGWQSRINAALKHHLARRKSG